MTAAAIYDTECTKCGAQMKLEGKVYECPSCGHKISKDDYEEGRWRRR